MLKTIYLLGHQQLCFYGSSNVTYTYVFVRECVHMYIHTYEKYTTVSPEVKQSDKESQNYEGIK